jgi:hypothetical protein
MDAFELIDLSRMDTGEKIMLMSMYAVIGLLTKIWIKRNPKEVEKLFKNPD